MLLAAPPTRLRALRRPHFALTCLGVCFALIVSVAAGFSGPCPGWWVYLPTGPSASHYTDVGNLIEFSLLPDQRVYFGAKWCPPPDLPRAYRMTAFLLRARPGSRVVLAIDRACTFGSVRSVLRGLKSQGIRGVTLRVDPPPDRPLLPAGA